MRPHSLENPDMPVSNDSDRQARSRKVRAEAGGKQIAVMLTPAAAAKLAAWVARGETIAGVVNRLIEKSKPLPIDKGAHQNPR
jgi:hypothetical protein